MGENFGITVEGNINDDIFNRMKEILDSLGAVSTGNQFGGNVSEYFFAVEPKYLIHTQKILRDQIRDENISFDIM